MSENTKGSGILIKISSNVAASPETVGRIPAGSIKISKSQRVLKADQLVEQTQIQIQKFDAPRFQSLPKSGTTVQTVEDLKRNMGRLTDLHSRLRFMIKELEDLVGTRK